MSFAVYGWAIHFSTLGRSCVRIWSLGCLRIGVSSSGMSCMPFRAFPFFTPVHIFQRYTCFLVFLVLWVRGIVVLSILSTFVAFLAAFWFSPHPFYLVHNSDLVSYFLFALFDIARSGLGFPYPPLSVFVLRRVLVSLFAI